jgi:hypothetical protein
MTASEMTANPGPGGASNRHLTRRATPNRNGSSGAVLACAGSWPGRAWI